MNNQLCNKIENYIQNKIRYDTKNQISDHVRYQLRSMSVLIWKDIGRGRILLDISNILGQRMI